MQLILTLNGVKLQYNVEPMGEKIIAVAQGQLEEDELAVALRSMV